MFSSDTPANRNIIITFFIGRRRCSFFVLTISNDHLFPFTLVRLFITSIAISAILKRNHLFLAYSQSHVYFILILICPLD
jgi:hypothetical protein